MIEPTPGRIVYYKEQGVRDPLPAMIVLVHNARLVDLAVVTFQGIHGHARVQLLQADDKPATRSWCEWMDYQKGQAAKNDSLADTLKQRLDAVEKILGGHQDLIKNLMAQNVNPIVSKKETK